MTPRMSRKTNETLLIERAFQTGENHGRLEAHAKHDHVPQLSMSRNFAPQCAEVR